MSSKMMNSAGRPSLQLGRGIDTMIGSPMGVAIVPDEAKIDPNNSGQIVSYDISVIESSTELEDSLGLSVGAEMRYGLFSASGKFEMREKSQYKGFATYVLAKCDVRNPPVGLFDPGAKPEAAGYVDRGDTFRKAYGDGFVRAALTGGEFYVLLEIVHDETSTQKSLAASVQAEYNGFVGGGEVNFEMSAETKSKWSQSQTRIVQYQASGTGVNTSVVSDPDEVMVRLKEFPQIVKDNPVSIQVEVASYDTIPQLQANLEARSALRAALDDCARKKISYKQIIDELDFFLTGQNRSLFLDPPSDDEVQITKTKYTKAWNAVAEHAIALMESGTPIGMFEEPADLLPIRLNRILSAVEETEVVVPFVLGRSLDEAKQQMNQAGLVAIPRARDLGQDNSTPRFQVLAVSPPEGSSTKKGDQVFLDYAHRKSEFILAMERDRIDALVSLVSFAR